MIRDTSLSELILNFVVANQWRDVLILTDHNPVPTTRLLSTVLVASAVVSLTPSANFSSLLSTAITTKRQHNIIVWCRMKWKVELVMPAQLLGMFENRFTWVIIQETRKELQQFLELSELDKFLLPDSNMFSLVKHRNVDKPIDCRLVRLLHQKLNYSHNIEIVQMDGANARRIMHGYSRSLPLEGYELKIGTFHVPPFISIKRRGPQAIFDGYTAELVHILATYLGFRYRYIIQRPPAFGGLNKGNWTGLVGTVHREEVDIGALYFALTPERKMAVKYSAPIYTAQNVAVIRRSLDTSQQWSILLYKEPFSIVLWLACGAMCVLVFTCIVVTLNVCWFCRDGDQFPSREQSIIAEATWNVICALLQTGTTQLSSVRSSQLVFLGFTVFILLVTRSYLSLLTAHLTMKPEPNQYKNLDEVLDGGKYGITMLGHTSIYEEFRNAKSGTLKRVWDKMQSDPASIVASTDLGYKMSLKQDYVHVTAEPFAVRRIRNSHCKLEFIKERFLRATIGLIFPKKSTLTEVISLKILSMTSSGTLKKLEAKHLPPFDPRTCVSNPSTTIPIQQVVGAFALLFTGILAALLYFLLENVHEKLRNVHIS